MKNELATGWIGLDVGGANLKAADGRGEAVSLPFALWREPQRLVGRIAETLACLGNGPPAGVALTMTGELADCYATKAEGVRHIVESTLAAAPGGEVRVATVDDGWLAPGEAIADPMRVAAANWRLFARLVAKRSGDGRGLVADAGSTTVDLIPIESGRVATASRTDLDRLLAGELIYTGVRRTPVCAVTRTLPFRGRDCPVAAELFATTADAWLLLGELPESEVAATADGRPLTRNAAVARLGRCLCADEAEFTPDDALAAAARIAETQTQHVADALSHHVSGSAGFGVIVVGGEGEFLLRRAIERMGGDNEPLSSATMLGDAPSACGPAHAAAVLARHELPGGSHR